MALFNIFKRKIIGIDVDSVKTRIYAKGEGVVLEEFSVVAINKQDKTYFIVGNDVKKMRDSSDFETYRVFTDGIICSFEVFEIAIKYFISKVYKNSILTNMDVYVAIPSGATPVELRAAKDSVETAGATRVFFVDKEMVTAIGCEIPIMEPIGSVILNIGGDSTTVSLITSGKKIDSLTTRVGGKDIIDEISKQVKESTNLILENLRNVLEKTPPEFATDIIDNAIKLTGEGGKGALHHVKKKLEEATGLPFHIMDNADTSTIDGIGRVIENIEKFKDVVIIPDQKDNKNTEKQSDKLNQKIEKPKSQSLEDYDWVTEEDLQKPSESFIKLKKRLLEDVDFAEVTVASNGANLKSWITSLSKEEILEAVKIAQSVPDQETPTYMVWKKGKENPFVTDAVNIPGVEISFLCPICHESITSQSPKYDPILGGDIQCPNCNGISHIPTLFFTNSNTKGLKITGGVVVPMSMFGEWYFSHPIHISLIKDMSTDLDLYGYYGLLAYCAKCKHRYKSTVLPPFAITQETQHYSGNSTFFNAKTERSLKDWNALIAGYCPSCNNDKLIAIMTDIPDYVREGIETWKKTGCWPE